MILKRTDGWWDRYFLDMCDFVSRASKDPSTQVGCVIVRPDKTIASTGFNGFPRGMPDNSAWLNNREEKYKRIIHAEMNAIQNARGSVEGCTLYCTKLFTCSRCTVHIINAGISRVVARATPNERWAEDIEMSKQMYNDAGVQWKLLTGHEV